MEVPVKDPVGPFFWEHMGGGEVGDGNGLALPAVPEAVGVVVEPVFRVVADGIQRDPQVIGVGVPAGSLFRLIQSPCHIAQSRQGVVINGVQIRGEKGEKIRLLIADPGISTGGVIGDTGQADAVVMAGVKETEKLDEPFPLGHAVALEPCVPADAGIVGALHQGRVAI